MRDIVAILTDMEGATGIAKRRECHRGTEAWKKEGRVHLTADALSCLAGVQDAGIALDKISLREMHDTGANLLVSQLPHGLDYRPGIAAGPVPMLGELTRAKTVLLLAQHDTDQQAFFPHCFHGAVDAVVINGRAVNEAVMLAFVLAEHGSEVCLVQGDAYTTNRVREFFPNMTVVTTRKSFEDLHPAARIVLEQREREELQTATVAALQQRSPVVLQGLSAPYKVQVFERSGRKLRGQGWPMRRMGESWFFEAPSMTTALQLLFSMCYVPAYAKSLMPSIIALRNRWYAAKHKAG